MKISKKTDYALRALISLSAKPGIKQTISSIAQENDIPKRFLEHIMLDMKNHGWVTGLPGREGGYVLSFPPEKINIGKIIRHFDGMIAPIECVSVNKYEKCSQEIKCRFRRVFLDIRNYTAQILDKISLADLNKTIPVDQKEVMDTSFVDGSGI